MLEAIKQIDLNFSQHATKIISQTDGMSTRSSNCLSVSNSGLSCDTFNIIHIHDGEGLEIQELESAISNFKNSMLNYCIWVNSENLTLRLEQFFSANAVSKQNSEVGMLLHLENYLFTQNETHQNIVVADSPQLIRDYAGVIAKNWNPVDQNVLSYYEKTSSSYLEEEKVTLLIYHHEGKPVSTIEMFEDRSGTIGIYGLATLSHMQGQGIGSLMMSFALNRAKEKAHKKVVLQATEDGIGIYKKYGFEPLTTYYEFA